MLFTLDSQKWTKQELKGMISLVSFLKQTIKGDLGKITYSLLQCDTLYNL